MASSTSRLCGEVGFGSALAAACQSTQDIRRRAVAISPSIGSTGVAPSDVQDETGQPQAAAAPPPTMRAA